MQPRGAMAAAALLNAPMIKNKFLSDAMFLCCKPKIVNTCACKSGKSSSFVVICYASFIFLINDSLAYTSLGFNVLGCSAMSS